MQVVRHFVAFLDLIAVEPVGKQSILLVHVVAVLTLDEHVVGQLGLVDGIVLTGVDVERVGHGVGRELVG